MCVCVCVCSPARSLLIIECSSAYFLFVDQQVFWYLFFLCNTMLSSSPLFSSFYFLIPSSFRYSPFHHLLLCPLFDTDIHIFSPLVLSLILFCLPYPISFTSFLSSFINHIFTYSFPFFLIYIFSLYYLSCLVFPQAVTMDSFFRVTWNDWRLNYPEEEEKEKGSKNSYGDEDPVKRMIMNHVILEEVWLPDPYIFNVRDINTVRLLQKDVRGVLLYSDGTLFVSIL